MTDISWNPCTVRLGDLQPWERNPKTINRANATRLLDLWDRLGQFQTIAIGPENEVYDGHQRLSCLLPVHGSDYEVMALRSSRTLTEAEREALVLGAHVGTIGQFDWDALSGWDARQLQEWGMDEGTLDTWKQDVNALTAMLISEAGASELPPVGSLAERFIVPPFSVLDARQGYWQKRKDDWIALGIKGELGRGTGGATPPHPPGVTRNPDGTLNYSGGDNIAERFDRQRQPASAPKSVAGKSANGREFGRAFGEDIMRGESKNFGVISGSPLPLDRAKVKKQEYPPEEGWRRTGLTYAAGTPRRDEVSLILQEGGGTSIFDPVLCELVYRWFSPPGGHVLDPFAGESTKGIVAGYLGLNYTGIELRQEQVDVNYVQSADIFGENPDCTPADIPIKISAASARELRNGCQVGIDAGGHISPNWICGDSYELEKHLPAGEFYDLIFTSPPYYDLEIYSESEADGSAFETYDKFMAWYETVFRQAVARLKENRFLVVKVGEIRDKKTGIYRNFVGDNISTFLRLGLNYYNEAILVTAVGSLPIRVGKQFSNYRKLGKTHQNILIFYKGSPATIKTEFPSEIECADLSEQTD